MSADQTQQGAEATLPPTESSTQPKPNNSLPYQGKAVGSNSLRLLTIQRATQERDPVVCTLVEVPFGDKPKFNALSYTWGDSAPDDPTITLDGFPFRVRRNLFDALVFLRHQTVYPVRQYWIDAICINQNDVDERNRQVRIMDQIYFRATAVIIWLGQRYARFEEAEVAKPQGLMLPENEAQPPEDDGEQGLPSESDTVIRRRQLCVNLLADRYWERVWILQEITKAWVLHVCFGKKSYTWDGFLDFLREHTDGTSGARELTNPFSLHLALRAKKQRGSHRLIDLFKEHQHAKCSVLHDKVYGLLGMATDGVGFPIDYSKSLYELWTDTMVFLNEKKLLSVSDSFIDNGVLVKKLLMIDGGDTRRTATTTTTSGAAVTTAAETGATLQNGNMSPDQIDASQLIDISSEEYEIWSASSRSPALHPRAFFLRVTVLGSVVCVGPSIGGIMAQPDVLSTWKSTIGQLYETDELDELDDAHWESDNLLRELMESEDVKTAASCISLPATVVFSPETIYTGGSPSSADIQPFSSTTETAEAGRENANVAAPVEPKLYFLKAFSGVTRNKMGVAAGVVRPGDILCEVASHRLLVRVYPEGPLEDKACVVGTALKTEDLCRGNSYGYTPNDSHIIDRYAEIFIGLEALSSLADLQEI